MKIGTKIILTQKGWCERDRLPMRGTGLSLKYNKTLEIEIATSLCGVSCTYRLWHE